MSDKRATRRRIGIARDAFAEIGHQGPAPFAVDPEPGAAADPIDSGEDPVRPPVRGRRFAAVEFVAVGGDDERESWMRVERDQSEAHR